MHKKVKRGEKKYNFSIIKTKFKSSTYMNSNAQKVKKYNFGNSWLFGARGAEGGWV